MSYNYHCFTTLLVCKPDLASYTNNAHLMCDIIIINTCPWLPPTLVK